MTFPKNIDWEATEQKYEYEFWNWCCNEGHHNEDYILDNWGELFEKFADQLKDEDFVYEPATIPS